jgi:hypothetical protein
MLKSATIDLSSESRTSYMNSLQTLNTYNYQYNHQEPNGSYAPFSPAGA